MKEDGTHHCDAGTASETEAVATGEDKYAQSEETLFSLQFSAVLIEHLRLMSRALHSLQGLTLNEYCTIMVLNVAKKPLSCAALVDALVLKQGTVFALLSNLENKGIVLKRVDKADGRAMLVVLTQKGRRLAKELNDQISALMRQTFWRSMTASETFAPLEEYRAQLERLRGHPSPLFSDVKSSRKLVLAMLFRIISLVVGRWKNSVRALCGLSLNEGRILVLLELYGSLNLGDISRKLFVAPSNVAVLCSRLREQNLIEITVDDEDARRKICRCTHRGLRLSRELFSVLRKTTRDSYISYSDASVIALNAQHMRMYCELEKAIQIEHLLNQYK